MGEATSGKRILFVDDEPSIRMTLPPVLQQAGFDVHIAESVGDAIFEINSHQFDALISDLNIGEEGDGFLVTSAMRHIQPNCVTFILTGYPAFETALQAIHSQVDDYLVKPVQVESLITAVNERLSNRAAKLPVPANRLSDFLKENVNSIVQTALEMIKHDAKVADPGVACGFIERHFTAFLNSLAEQVDRNGEQVNNEALHSAANYGKAPGRKKGPGGALIVREFGHLENAVYTQLQRNLTNAEAVNTLVADLRTLHRGLNLLLEQALENVGRASPSRARK